MKASLRSTRIAPKKANLVAGMIRGLTVKEAKASLERTNKKAARLLEDLLDSAVANARQNDNQDPDALVIKTLVINKAQAYHRGVPMARGRVRPMRKFLSHIELTLGIADEDEDEKKPKNPRNPKSKTSSASSDSSASSESAQKSKKTSSQTTKKPADSAKKKPSEKGKSAKSETAASASASPRAKKSPAKKSPSKS